MFGRPRHSYQLCVSGMIIIQTLRLELGMVPNVKVTRRQIRFLLGQGRAWMIQPLHVHAGVPAELRGQYSVPHDEVWGGVGDPGWRTLARWAAGAPYGVPGLSGPHP